MAHRRLLHVTLALALLAALLPGGAHAQLETEPELLDPVTELIHRIEAGEVTLAFDSAQGYLASLLEALDVPVSSQGLVFSRTSLQTDRISPWSPRAIYFNDDVYVGFVQESPILELAAVDPDDGSVFYTLVQQELEKPTFLRESTTCLMCHDSRVTEGVPGVMVRSTLTDRHGNTVTPVHEDASTDRTPMSKRLGGWYVTGEAASFPHAGNALAPELFSEIHDPQAYLRDFDMAVQKVEDLGERFSPEPYISEHSDLVALLVLSHQTRVHNLIALTQESTREALREQEAVLRSTGEEPPESGLTPSSRVRVEGAVERLLSAMLFAGEAPLGGPVRGSTGFAAEFTALGPVDSQGRSLRDFDLGDRIFRYPLSFLIYSDAFAALPDVAKAVYFERLEAVLSGEDTSEAFAHLDAGTRAAIREILSETLPDYARFTG